MEKAPVPPGRDAVRGPQLQRCVVSGHAPRGLGAPVSLVAIGQFKYSLDDVLLSLVTPDIATQRLRSVLLGRRPENNCKHQTIVLPSHEAPFQVLAVSRYVNTQHWPHTLLAGPREMVVAFGTGEVMSSNGKRIGYEVMQTVSLDQTFPRSPALPRTQMIRARVFWEQPDGTVGMYGKTFADGISHPGLGDAEYVLSGGHVHLEVRTAHARGQEAALVSQEPEGDHPHAAARDACGWLRCVWDRQTKESSGEA